MARRRRPSDAPFPVRMGQVRHLALGLAQNEMARRGLDAIGVDPEALIARLHAAADTAEQAMSRSELPVTR